MQQRFNAASETFISPDASVGARGEALDSEELEAVLDTLLLGALEAVLEMAQVLVLVLVLVAVGVGSAAPISASMLSKSSSVCASATVVSRHLPFL
jgi:hypothetical protein